MKLHKAAFAVITASIYVISCIAAVASDSGLAGNWKGESICTIKDSPCHDEHVIYRVEEPDSTGKMKIQMDKVVDGKPELMGTVNCAFDKAASTVTCTTQRGVWKFTVTGKKMEGTLVLDDGRLYRRISVTQATNNKTNDSQ